jgi:uroporphyrinogen-III decarboxylase
MSPMSVRERMLAAYRGQAPDRYPVSIYSRYLPRGDKERVARAQGLGIVDYYPIVSLLAPPWHLSSGLVSEVKGADLQVRYVWENGKMAEVRTYATPVGEVTQRTVQDPTYGSDWIDKFYIQSRDDYRVVQYLVEHTVFRPNFGGLASRIRTLGEDGVVLGRLDRAPYQKMLIELAGPEQFLLDLHTDPDPVLELLDAMARRLDEAFAMVVDSPAEVVWQPDNVTADLTPPDAFARYCLPFYARRGAALAGAGKPYVVHMDGRLGPLKDHIAGAAFDVVESFSLPLIGNDLTYSAARAAWPGKAILPNFPSNLSDRPPEEIEAFVESLLHEVGTGAPFMLQVSEDLPPGAWERVVPVVCRAVERHASG